MSESAPEQTQDLRVVIAGGGEVGLQTASLLKDRGHKIVIIEDDPERCEYIADEYVGSVFEGDATKPGVLRQVQLDRTDVVAALTDDEAANFAVCMAAQRMSDVRTVLRTRGEPDELYEQFVDGVVFPESLGARAAANEIIGKGVRTVEDVFGDVEIMEIEVAEDAPVAGKRLDEVRFPRGSLIVVDYRGNRIGGPETVLEPGHRYVVAAESGVTDEIMNLMRG